MKILYKAQKGKLITSDYNKNRLLDDIKANENAMYKLERLSPESAKQRG